MIERKVQNVFFPFRHEIHPHPLSISLSARLSGHRHHAKKCSSWFCMHRLCTKSTFLQFSFRRISSWEFGLSVSRHSSSVSHVQLPFLWFTCAHTIALCIIARIEMIPRRIFVASVRTDGIWSRWMDGNKSTPIQLLCTLHVNIDASLISDRIHSPENEVIRTEFEANDSPRQMSRLWVIYRCSQFLFQFSLLLDEIQFNANRFV